MEGNIDLESTLAELEIDDIHPLTDAEKQAKVIHLLKSRSGVYHPAAAETSAMAARRPERGSHAPDSFHYYNTWDFNVLGTIFEQQTGSMIFDEFNERIAEPLGMQDFEPDKCFYTHEREHSQHPAYFFRMSTRDRARFGLLCLRNGNWNGTQLVPEDWVRNCMAEHSSGLIPELDLVLAISGDTENGAARAGTECIQLLDLILRARIECSKGNNDRNEAPVSGRGFVRSGDCPPKQLLDPFPGRDR